MKKTIAVAALLAVSAVSGVAYTGDESWFEVSKDKSVYLGVERTFLDTMKEGYQLSLKTELAGKQYGDIKSYWGNQLSCATLKQKDKDKRVSYIRISSYKKFAYDIPHAKIKSDIYGGIKCTLNFIDGLSKDGISFGGFAGVESSLYKNVYAALEGSVDRGMYFKDPRWLSNRSIGLYVGYKF